MHDNREAISGLKWIPWQLLPEDPSIPHGCIPWHWNGSKPTPWRCLNQGKFWVAPHRHVWKPLTLPATLSGRCRTGDSRSSCAESYRHWCGNEHGATSCPALASTPPPLHPAGACCTSPSTTSTKSEIRILIRVPLSISSKTEARTHTLRHQLQNMCP